MPDGPKQIPDADWQKVKKYAGKYGVDPLLLVAIGIHETNWGKTGLGPKGLILGVGAYDSGATFKYAGLDKQLDQGAKILKSHGVTTIADVTAGKAAFWATSANWKDGVLAAYKTLGKSGSFLPDVSLPNLDVSTAIRDTANAFLTQMYRTGMSAAVLFGAASLIILGIIVLLRQPLSRAATKVAEVAK